LLSLTVISAAQLSPIGRGGAQLRAGAAAVDDSIEEWRFIFSRAAFWFEN
jgi:hypothetical protein